MVKVPLWAYYCSAPCATVHKYMNTELQLFSITRKRKPDYEYGALHKVFENKLRQDFKAESINQKWCTDFTYLFLMDGSKRYDCTIIDPHDRRSTDHGKIPGSFIQSRGGVLEFDSVLAWLPIEKTEIDIKELWWNPEYRLISIIYDSIMVFAKDTDNYLTMEYYGGNEGKIIFYMDVQTGNILENDKNRKEEKQRYFAKNAVICIGELMIE